jgi:hypothetical protein
LGSPYAGSERYAEPRVERNLDVVAERTAAEAERLAAVPSPAAA